jgi:hypothetical protein
MIMRAVRTKQQRYLRKLRQRACTARLVHKPGREQTTWEEPATRVQLRRTFLGVEELEASGTRSAMEAQATIVDAVTIHDRTQRKTRKSGGSGW